jgi:hypothetical protein
VSAQNAVDTVFINKAADTNIRIVTYQKIDTLIIVKVADSTQIKLTDTIGKVKPPKPQYWFFTNTGSLTFNQTSYSAYWSKGGENSLSGTVVYNGQIKYDKNNSKFVNDLKLVYGLMKPQSVDYLRKTEDLIDFSSNYGIKYSKNWYASTELAFKTQFNEGYKYPDTTNLVSDFMAPGYITLSLGMKYDPNKFFSLFMSPAAGKFTIVANQKMADAGNYGVPAAEYENDTILIKHGEKLNREFGISAVLKYKKDVVKNLNLDSKLTLYNNYLDYNNNNRWNVDIDWSGTLNYTMNKYITTRFAFHMIYDHDTKFQIMEEQNGEEVEIGKGPRMQFQQVFGVGITLKLNS